MTSDSIVTRRRMLQVTGCTVVGGLAGCIGTQTNDGHEDSGATEDDHHHDDGEDVGHHEDNSHGDGSHGHDGTVGDPTDAAEVRMLTTNDGSHFDPHIVRVTVGGTVTFVNKSGSHDTTAYHSDNDQPHLAPTGAAAWNSDRLSEEGATFEHTFETEGVYHYFCTPHESSGMIGSVIVGEPDAHEQPALEELPADKPERVHEKIEELNAMCNEALGHTH